MKIYLAGKIEQNDWRHDVVPGLRSAGTAGDPTMGPHWRWPEMEVPGTGCTYVGPYFISCDHGCAHGPAQHGVGASSGIENGAYSNPDRTDTFNLCVDAIKKCDIFFAWLENDSSDPSDKYDWGHCTAYGTLVEIGMAVALGKRVVIGTPTYMCANNQEQECTGGHGCQCAGGELWFALKSASDHIRAADPRLALEALGLRGMAASSLCESPLETAFWDAYLITRLPGLRGLIPQHKVTVGGKNYRLDFAIPDRKIAFEMDGRTYHNTKEAFARDSRRDLNLELAGWRVHRFDGDLIRENPDNIVRIAAKLAGDDA